MDNQTRSKDWQHYQLSPDLQYYLAMVTAYQNAFSKGTSVLPKPDLNQPANITTSDVDTFESLETVEADLEMALVRLEIAEDITDTTHQALDALKDCFCRDVQKNLVILTPKLERLVVIFAKQFRLILDALKFEPLQTNLTELLHSMHTIFNIIFRSPLLLPIISPESFRQLFEALLPFFDLSLPQIDASFKDKLQQFTSSLFSFNYKQNNLFLALLRLTYSTFLQFAKEPDVNRAQMDTLISWLEILVTFFTSEAKLSTLNLDLIFDQLNQILETYPASPYEQIRDFRLLEVLRQIIFKIVHYKGHTIWDHLRLINLNHDHEPALVRYLRLALERVDLTSTNPSSSELKTSSGDVILDITNQGVAPIDIEAINTTIPIELTQAITHLAISLDPSTTKEAFEYLNEQFPDASNQISSPQLDILISCCCRQFRILVLHHLMTTKYQPIALQIFHFNITLLKQLIYWPQFAIIQKITLFELLTLLFTFHTPYLAEIGLAEPATALQEAIFTCETQLNKTVLVVTCLSMLTFIESCENITFEHRNINFILLRRLAGESLWSTLVPFAITPTAKDFEDQLDLKLVLGGLEEYLKLIYSSEDAFDRLRKPIEAFLTSTNLYKRLNTPPSTTLDVLLQLTYIITKFTPKSTLYSYINDLEVNSETSNRTNILDSFFTLFYHLMPPDSNSTKANPLEPQPIRNLSHHFEMLTTILSLLDRQLNSPSWHYNAIKPVDAVDVPNQTKIAKNFDLTGKIPEINGDTFLKDFKILQTSTQLFHNQPASVSPITVNELIRVLTRFLLLLDYNEPFFKQPNIFATVERYKIQSITAVGQLLVDLFQDVGSVVHQHITEQTLAFLLEINTCLVRNYYDFYISSKATVKAPFFSIEDDTIPWPDTLQHALLHNSKSKTLLLATLKYFLGSSMRLIITTTSWTTAMATTKYSYLQSVINVVEAVLTRVGLFAVEADLVLEPKMLGDFLIAVNQHLVDYRGTFMEAERDYQLLEALKRGINLIVAANRSTVLETLASITTSSNIPSWPIFDYTEHRLKYY